MYAWASHRGRDNAIQSSIKEENLNLNAYVTGYYNHVCSHDGDYVQVMFNSASLPLLFSQRTWVTFNSSAVLKCQQCPFTNRLAAAFASCMSMVHVSSPSLSKPRAPNTQRTLGMSCHTFDSIIHFPAKQCIPLTHSNPSLSSWRQRGLLFSLKETVHTY